MFDLGIQELIVIFVVALLVFGPKKLPEIGRTLGRGMNELKRAMQGVKEQMDSEMHEITESEGLKELKELKDSMSLNNIITPEQQSSITESLKFSDDPYNSIPEQSSGEADASSQSVEEYESNDMESGYGSMDADAHVEANDSVIQPEEILAESDTAEQDQENSSSEDNKKSDGQAEGSV
ncbi:MAG: twin-arginine translocase TatA/TatE family subunit [Dissulfurispiraceae bacterium]|jgi:TatA/E family protein of Tat protein translocase|nr:twin-arginine translocase TatA/TatE family subunit [Dissulfurispiraceae bacterium]